VIAIRSPESGFSLVELLIGMLIAVTLYAMVLGPTKEYIQRQKLQRCAENLRKLHMTLALYANEHDGAYPVLADARSSNDAFSLLVPKYTTDTSVFACPGGGHAGYAYVMGLRSDGGSDAMLLSDAQVNTDPKPRGARMFSEAETGPGANHGNAGGNVIFADGHLETVGPNAPRDFLLPPGAKLLNPAQ
jgi:prepilin-type processing-associated H-X9-DG protein